MNKRYPIMPALALLLAWPAVAGAQQDAAGARQHFQKGTQAYELGAFDEAVREYTEAYRLKDDPAILYNIGQAHRLAQHPKEAVFFYKMFLTKQPGASNRREVEAKIAALEALIAQQQKTQNMPPDSTKPEGAPPETPTPATAPAPSLPQPETPASMAAPSASGRTKRIAGIAVGAAGVATLVAGVALSALAKQASDELTRANSNGLPFNRSQYNTGQTEGTAGPALIGVGAALVVAGAIVAALGFRDARRAERAGVTRWLATNAANLGATWSWR